MAQAPREPGDALRLHQANERTMLAWLRTGIALMAFGFAIARFGLFLHQVALLDTTPHPHAPRVGSEWLGVGLVLMGMATNVVGVVRYGTVRLTIMRNEITAPSPGVVYLLGALGAVVGLVMAVMLARSLAH